MTLPNIFPTVRGLFVIPDAISCHESLGAHPETPAKTMARPAGLEPATARLEGGNSEKNTSRHSALSRVRKCAAHFLTGFALVTATACAQDEPRDAAGHSILEPANIVADPETGCQYVFWVGYGNKSAVITPRLARDGQPLCGSAP